MERIILLLFVSVVLSCKTNIKTKDNKTIYVLDKKLTESILDKYLKIKNKEDYCIMFNVDYCCIGEDRMITLKNCENEPKLQKLKNKIHCYLKLNDTIFLPVISSADLLFEEETRFEPLRGVGRDGSTYFILNGADKLLEIR